jgi:hypothetical protein
MERELYLEHSISLFWKKKFSKGRRESTVYVASRQNIKNAKKNGHKETVAPVTIFKNMKKHLFSNIFKT